MSKSHQYNFIKIIMTVLVVIAHITRMYTGNGVVVPHNQSLLLDYLTRFIYGFHMPIFIMMSGAIYYYCIYDLDKYKNKKEFVITKFKRLIIPYLVFGILYVAPIMTTLNFTDNSFIHYVVFDVLFCLDSRHLWFLYYLFGYFVLYYFILRNKDNLLQLSLLLIIYLLVYKLNIPIISNFSFYALFFNLGLMYNKYFDIINKKLSNKFILSVIVLILYGILAALTENRLIINVFGSMTVMFLLINICSKNINIENKVLKILKEYSMGIYLFHPMIIYILFYFLGQYDISPYILSSIIFIITSAISFYLTFIVKKSKLRFILGE